MKRSVAAGLMMCILLPVALGTTISWGATTDTGCWDEYDSSGARYYRTVAPKGVPLSKCTPGAGCFSGYNAKGKVDRLYVPYKSNAGTACTTAATTTTVPTTIASTTTTTLVASPTAHFGLVPVGGTLPSDADCAARIRPMTENRPENETANATPGTTANATYPRVTGNFTGTTDEILQWASCKWGIDEDWVRAQIVNESNWQQTALGDFTTNSDACAPTFPIGSYPPQWNGDREHTNECPESIGLGQVRWLYHQSAFANNDATKSSAYNVDYTYAVWRECYEGRFGWLNDVERGATYAAGDAKGCLGVWFAGRWYTDAAKWYIARFEETLNARSWEQSWFGPALVASSTSATVAPTTVAPTTVTTTTTATTAAPSTTAATTAAPTTVAPTTMAPTTTQAASTQSSGAQFVATFDGNSGLDRFRWGVYHRGVAHHEARTPKPSGVNNNVGAVGSWTGDHDLACGGPSTQRPLITEFTQDATGANGWRPYVDFHTEELLYVCKDHMMSSMGDVAAFSVLWFSPDQVFSDVTTVSFDVNLTDLGTRQWWKVGVVSDALYQSTYLTGWEGNYVPVPGHLVSDVGSSDLDGSLVGPDRLIATWSGAASNAGRQGMAIGSTKIPCGADGGTDKATRHPVSLTDNGDGTVTFSVAGSSCTTAGAFPSCPCRVVFYDQNYNPNKDGVPIGYTWHWDNIIVR